jgi:DNA-binding winged helix-turn-helix (wHTH) protein/tetratricopeptide (TPR) repeat protein
MNDDPNAKYRFGRFELQPRERRLLRDGTPIPLPGKAFDLLVCLVGRAPSLVKKDELFEVLWPDTIVEESNLNYTLSIVRKALQDGDAGLRAIETVPRQGYRFAAGVERVFETQPIPTPPDNEDRPPLRLVQRESEIEALHSALSRAHAGRRQVVFVTGEAGIGKTSLVDRFLFDVGRKHQIAIARGQCIEHRGEAEAYMPVLEAFGRLGRQPDGRTVLEILDRSAPSWLVQMPGLVNREQLGALQQRLHGQTRERMLREMEEAIVALTAVAPLVLVLEDLHWSDLSTIDLLSRIARSADPARLLVIGTYRSPEALAASHPLHAIVQELQLRGACQRISLAPLSRPSVSGYLDERFGGAIPGSVIDLIHRRTEGSPLFISAVVESWRVAGILSQAGGRWTWRTEAAERALAVPESLRAFIEEQVRQLTAFEREALEAAAIVGTDVSAAVLAGALERSIRDVETACANLTRVGQFLRAAGDIEYPDGTVSDRYEFVHAFYIEVLCALMPAGRRVRLHQQTGLTLEHLHAGRAHEAAAQLATHFVEARDARKSVTYLQRAAEQSLARSAPREAIARLEEAMRMLPRIAETPERAELELSVQAMLATALTATRGFSDAAAEAAYRRAYDLAKSMATPRLFPIAFGLATVLELRGHYRESQRIIEEHLPAQEACGSFLMEARDLLACSAYHQGNFDRALDHALKGLESFREGQHSPLTGCFGEHPGVGCCTWAALALWFLGRADQALDYAHRALTWAEAPGHLYTLANARAQLACLHQLRREPAETQRWAALTIELGEQQGFAHRVAVGQVLHGWARAAQGSLTGGLAELERGLDGAGRIGMGLDRPYFLALDAEILAADGRFDRALGAIDEAQQQASSNRSFFYAAELWRLRGTILLAAHGPRARMQEAEECFERAVEIATEQQARYLLLRAELARARLGGAAGPSPADELSALCSTFTEGLDTPDLRDAVQFTAPRSARVL